MPIEDFIIFVYCCVEEQLNKILMGHKIRQRGFQPKFSDSEVITMEIVGEYLGMDCDKHIWGYFRQHWLSWFPNLGVRTTFARQAANLWQYKQIIQQKLAFEIGILRDNIHMIDGFPIPVCRYKRARRSKLFKGEASFGYCASKDEKYYGFHGHLIVNFDGGVCSFELTQAHIDEREAMIDMSKSISGLLIGDKGYISKDKKIFLHDMRQIDLQTPNRDNMEEKRRPNFINKLLKVRRKIETVIGQLSERFHIEKVRARDFWHLVSRISRKLLAHTMAVFINKQMGRDPLQFDGLVKP